MSAAGYMVAFPAAVNDSGHVVDGGRFVPRCGLVGRPWVDRSGLAERFATAAAAFVVADEAGAPVSASDLPAAGGWGVLDPRAAFARRYGAFDVSVVFDGEAALSARLVRPNLGTLLFIR